MEKKEKVNTRGRKENRIKKIGKKTFILFPSCPKTHKKSSKKREE